MALTKKQRQTFNELLNTKAEPFNIVVADDKKFTTDLGLDSLDIIDLILSIEDLFDICISEEKVEKVVTVADAYQLLDELL